MPNFSYAKFLVCQIPYLLIAAAADSRSHVLPFVSAHLLLAVDRPVSSLFCYSELIGGDEKGNAVVWNPDEGKVHYVYKMHDTRVTCLEWLAEENILLSASGDGSVKVWKYAQI